MIETVIVVKKILRNVILMENHVFAIISRKIATFAKMLININNHHFQFSYYYFLH